MFHLRRSKNKEFYMCIIASNGKETWRTSETYKRKQGAFRATFSAAKAFGTQWDGIYLEASKS